MNDINYIAAFLTLSCNLKCSYCINHHGHDLYARKQMDGKDWIAALNRLEPRPDLPITFQGGEPTMHKDFYEIINGINPNHPIDLLTNLELDHHEFMKNIHPLRMKRKAPYASIRVSWHVGQNDTEELLEKVAEMDAAGYSIGIWAVDHPHRIADIRQVQRRAWGLGIDFRIKEFLGELDGKHHGTLRYPDAVIGDIKSCECRTSELLIDPQGYTFRCHSDLYANRLPTGNITWDTNTGIKRIGMWIPCSVYGLCNSCDVKIKTNRFQEYGYSSVEIRDIK